MLVYVQIMTMLSWRLGLLSLDAPVNELVIDKGEHSHGDNQTMSLPNYLPSKNWVYFTCMFPLKATYGDPFYGFEVELADALRAEWGPYNYIVSSKKVGNTQQLTILT